MTKKFFVTRPSLPSLDKFVHSLEDIWQSRWLTNNGKYHQQFEEALCQHLGIKYCSLYANGTLALIAALQALLSYGKGNT